MTGTTIVFGASLSIDAAPGDAISFLPSYSGAQSLTFSTSCTIETLNASACLPPGTVLGGTSCLQCTLSAHLTGPLQNHSAYGVPRQRRHTSIKVDCQIVVKPLF